MNIIVQKFGGTSVRHEESRRQAASHVKQAVELGYKVVVVVSAMGRKGDPYATDTLLNLIELPLSSKREQDLLLSCGETISAVVFANKLNELQLSAVALTGAQAGFRTNDEFTNARITTMDCELLKAYLKSHDVVVVAGFQGVTESGDVATLGRGGSDTSATALGAALGAEWIDIFTDVAGVMTADPRIVKEARPLTEMTYTEICHMAYQGAKVIHPRAVEIAMQAHIPIHIRSTYSGERGTTVSERTDISDRIITGIAHIAGVTQIKVTAQDVQSDLPEKVFKAMANEKISVDFINIHPRAVAYTVMDDVVDQAVYALNKLGYELEVNRHCAKVSAVGAGMAGVPGVTAKIVSALSKQNIQILQSADSHTTIWVLVKGEDMVKAVNALHQIFHLEQ